MVGETKNYPNPGIAAVLSFLFTGLGQIYNGDITKGLILMTISAISILGLIIGAAIVIYSLFAQLGTWPINCITGFIIICMCILVIAGSGIYNIYDAYHRAEKKRRVIQ